jgi:predicted transcriptional regulator
MDAAKSKCEESKNAAKGLQSQLNEARKEKTEIEETLKTLQYAAQVECSNAAEMGKLKEQLRQKIEELREKIQEHTKLEREHAELQTSKRNLHVLFEQQQTEMSQHSARIDSLRQEIEAERSTEKEQSKNAIDLARSQTRTLEKEKSDLQAKLEHVRCSDSKLNEAHAALVAERDGLRSRNTELEAAEKASESKTTRAYEEKADAVRKFEQRLNDLQRDQERSDAALKEAEAKIQLQKTEHQKKIEFDRQKYESIVKTLTEELSKVRAQGTSLSKTQQQDLKPTSLQKPKLHSPQTVQTGKTRKKVSRENQTVLDVAGLSGTLVSASAQGTTRERNQGSDQSDNLFDEDHDIFGSDKLDKDQGCSIIDPAAVLVEDAQDIGGVIPPFVEDTQEVGVVFPPFVEETQDIGVFPPFVEDTQDIGGALVPFGNIANQLGQKPGDESSLSGPMTSDGLDQLEGDVRAVCTPVPEKHHRTQDSSREMIPETPIRHENAFLSGSYSSKSNGRPRSQANTASRLMPPPGTVSAHFDQPKLSPTVRSKNVSREDVDSKIHRSSGRSNDSSPGFEDHPFSFSNRNYDARRRSKIGKAVELPEHGQSQKRKLNFDQDVGSKRQRTPSQSLSHRLSPGSRPYSPHRSHSKPSRPSAGRGSAKSQASPSSNDILMHPSGSSDHARHTSSRTPSTKSACQSRSQESSTSSHAARLYGRRQTRSKSKLFPLD